MLLISLCFVVNWAVLSLIAHVTVFHWTLLLLLILLCCFVNYMYTVLFF